MAIKIRDYEVRLTKTKEERKQVRQLRYRVFVTEEGATPSEEQKNLGEEYDSYDRNADYMGVFYRGKIVGTYRIITRESAEKMDGFYTETEYDIEKIKKVRGNIAEMSRACVDAEFRENGLVMRMLWLGLGDYILKKKVKIIFGVASFVGRKPADFAQAVSYLYYNYLSPLSLRAVVNTAQMDENGVNPKLARMNILPRVFVDENDARAQMTPLIKGYLRLGATFGRGVFVDAPFNTCDVFVMLQTKNISRAYQKHFTGSETAFDHLGVGDGALKTVGKIMLLPFRGLRALTRLLLKEDEMEDAELIADPQEQQKESE